MAVSVLFLSRVFLVINLNGFGLAGLLAPVIPGWMPTIRLVAGGVILASVLVRLVADATRSECGDGPDSTAFPWASALCGSGYLCAASAEAVGARLVASATGGRGAYDAVRAAENDDDDDTSSELRRRPIVHTTGDDVTEDDEEEEADDQHGRRSPFRFPLECFFSTVAYAGYAIRDGHSIGRHRQSASAANLGIACGRADKWGCSAPSTCFLAITCVRKHDTRRELGEIDHSSAKEIGIDEGEKR